MKSKIIKMKLQFAQNVENVQQVGLRLKHCLVIDMVEKLFNPTVESVEANKLEDR